MQDTSEGIEDASPDSDENSSGVGRMPTKAAETAALPKQRRQTDAVSHPSRAPLWAKLVAHFSAPDCFVPAPEAGLRLPLFCLVVSYFGGSIPIGSRHSRHCWPRSHSRWHSRGDSRVARATGLKDPQFVVIDEVAGQLITLIAVPVSWKSMLLGFILFRGFDIVKPPPVRQLERLPEGIGIVVDDVAAGLYALIVMQLALHFGLLPR